MGLKIVDEGYDKTPRLEKDAFWDDTWVPLYSEASAHEKRYHQRQGSLAHIKIGRSVSQVRMVPRDGRRASIVKERIVNVKPGSGIGDILRPSSLLNLMKHASSSRSLERQRSPGSFRMETLTPGSPTNTPIEPIDKIDKKK
ncbi:Bestrophin homolog [Caenorhabditis elegans]|nr:Bestrophin homolog [Caenorhabditis elegans]CCD31122.1 Bestrophin homolog [Caenorhabditis elegans]|eukprot:NP_001255068.1 Bestrophin homolog 18 [Caenorhabditis elegans]